MTLIFDSKKCPGSVVVLKGGRALGIVTKITVDAGDFKAGDRYFIPIAKEWRHLFIHASTYAEVKKQLIDLFEFSERRLSTAFAPGKIP